MAGGNHSIDWISTYPFKNRWKIDSLKDCHYQGSKGDIEIGHDVWIAHGATILSGVKIGHGAVVGAMSVVTKDIPPYAIVGGNPARILKYRFDKQQIAKLLQIEWWGWSEAKIFENNKLFTEPERFLQTFPSNSDNC